MLLSGIAATALAVVSARAQEILGYQGPGFNEGYQNGDLVLAFFSSSDASNSSGVNSQGDLLFNIGSVSSYSGLAAGTYSVAGFNGSTTQVASQSVYGTPGWGSTDLVNSLTVPSSSTYWTVMGSNAGGTITTGSANQLWLTATSAAAQQSLGSQSQIAGQIYTIGSAANNNSVADGSSYDSAKTTGNYLISSGSWVGTQATAINSVSSSSDTMNLYSLVEGGSATELGTFTLTDTSGAYSLTFTAIPEPSTYAAILGALTVGFVLVRRKFGATRLNALA